VRGVSRVPAYRPSRPRTDSPWRTRTKRKRGQDGRIGAADIERRRKKLESAPCLLRFRPTAHSDPERRLCLRRQVFWLPDLMSRVFPGSLPVTSALRQFRLQRRDRPRFSRGSLLGPRGHLCFAHHNFPLPPVKRMGGAPCTRLAPNKPLEGRGTCVCVRVSAIPDPSLAEARPASRRSALPMARQRKGRRLQRPGLIATPPAARWCAAPRPGRRTADCRVAPGAPGTPAADRRP